MTPYALGMRLQKYVADLFRPIYDARPTKGSGNRGEHGDVQQPWFIVECKYRSTGSITINREVWKKLANDIPIGSSRLPLYIIENKYGEKFAILNLDDFMKIFKDSILEV